MELPPSPPKSGRFGQIAVYVEVGLERFDALSVNFCQKKHVQNTLNSRTWETPSVLRYGSWKVKPWDPVHGATPLPPQINVGLRARPRRFARLAMPCNIDFGGRGGAGDPKI